MFGDTLLPCCNLLTCFIPNSSINYCKFQRICIHDVPFKTLECSLNGWHLSLYKRKGKAVLKKWYSRSKTWIYSQSDDFKIKMCISLEGGKTQDMGEYHWWNYLTFVEVGNFVCVWSSILSEGDRDSNMR